MPEPFDAVDALLALVAENAVPPPAERERLRKAAGLTQKQIADAVGVARETVVAWEKGRGEPRAPHRQAYVRLLDGLVAHYPAPVNAASAAPKTLELALDFGNAPEAVPVPELVARTVDTSVPVGSDEVDSASDIAVTAEPEPRPAPVPEAAAPSHASAAHGVPERAAAGRSRGRSTSAPTDGPPADRFPHGPLAVLEIDGTRMVARLTGGRVIACPAKSLAAVVTWAVDIGLGAERLHRAGRDGDPLVVLTTGAAARLGLPDELADRRELRLPDEHKIVKQVTKDGWRLTRRGFGPWAKVYRPAETGRRRCVQFAVLPWGALDTRSWGDAASLPAAELADVLGEYASRVMTPRGSTAVAGLTLMTELRPPTQAVKDTVSGVWRSGPVAGSLTEAVDPAPPEAPDEHPVAQGRAGADVLVEEAYDWHRPLHAVTDAEDAQPWAVGLDVNAAFLAAASRLPVGLGAPVRVQAPTFDRRLPGCWYVDLSGVAVDLRLPSPFTPDGIAPTGPGWYATPTVAYAVELGADVAPFEAWIRPESGAYLDPWYTRLRDAYLATMADLGVTPGLSDVEFVAAMDGYRKVDPARALVLSAIKATVKGGIGKLRERPQGARYRPGDRWPALERPTWRPDIRAAVIANARVGMHRKMRRLATVADLYPLAVLSDCVVYPSAGPSPLDALPRGADDKPIAGGFRLGVSPGMVKHEGTRSLEWALGMLADERNPARHIKDGVDAVAEGE